MTARITAVGTQTGSDFLTAAEYNDAAGGWIGNVPVTSNVGSIGGETALGLATTVTVNASRRIRVSVECSMESNLTNGGVSIRIKEGSTQLVRRDFATSVAGAGVWVGASVILTPSTGSHTYTCYGARGLGLAGTVTMDASSDSPAYILVEDLGPA